MMFRYGVNCALEDVPSRNPVILRGSIEEIAGEAAEIGYDGLELFIRNPVQYDPQKLLAAARGNGLEFCGIATGMEYTLEGLSLISDEGTVRKAAVKRLCEHIDLARELGCTVIIGIMRGNIPDFRRYDLYENHLTEALGEICAYGKKQGVPLVLEAILRYINNYLNNVPETLRYLDRTGYDNLLIHIDSHLMNMEDKDIAQSVSLCKDRLGYVHFSDSNRAYPGGGNFDFKAMMNALMDIGYHGYITAECQPLPSPSGCAKRAYAYMRHLQALLEIERLPLE